jgi:hypothetical protein
VRLQRSLAARRAGRTAGARSLERWAVAEMSKTRLWLERIGIGFIAVLSLSAPFVFGFVYYLGVTDGIEINAGDPLRESRVWMIRERRGPTGIGWQYTAPVGSPRPGVQCARTQLTVFSWSGGLSLDASANSCRCFDAVAGGALSESNTPCQ